MPETIQNKQVFTLREVTGSIRKTIVERYRSAYWIKAELNKLNHYPQTGHCYPELVEKELGRIVAQMKATLWKDDFHKINNTFRKVLKEELKDGIKVLLYARIHFDPVYGMTLRIIDIDPSYTLGDLEREKQECIQKLRQEGLFDMNKSRVLPVLPQRIAIISVETSKGYADFLRIIDNNPWNYRFFHMLFPSVLQGEKAVFSIIRQLHRIRDVQQHFDLVVIIRGGGGDIGLSCYNTYELAKTVALFPLPVITGIGHATNETVTELVAFRNEITPTKVAESLIHRFHDFALDVSSANERIINHVHHKLSNVRQSFDHLLLLFKNQVSASLATSRNTLMTCTGAVGKQTAIITRQMRHFILKHHEKMLVVHAMSHIKQKKAATEDQTSSFLKTTEALLNDKKESLFAMEGKTGALHPANVLKRGYSITRSGGKAIRDSNRTSIGDVLETELFSGTLTSKVTDKKKHRESD